MALVTCPLCGSDVKVPKPTPHIPFTCRKCHSPFHLSRSGTAVLGKPPDVERDVEELKQLVREKMSEVPVGKIVGVLGFLLVAGLVISYLFRPTDSLKPTAESAARAFAANDLDTLKSMAAPGTVDELACWYEETHPGLVQQRDRWNGKNEAVQIGIAAEDPVSRRGAIVFSISPGFGNARDVSLASPGEATAGALGSFDSSMEWALSRGGHWLIDGRETYSKLHPSNASSVGSAQGAASTATR